MVACWTFLVSAGLMLPHFMRPKIAPIGAHLSLRSSTPDDARPPDGRQRNSTVESDEQSDSGGGEMNEFTDPDSEFYIDPAEIARLNHRLELSRTRRSLRGLPPDIHPLDDPDSELYHLCYDPVDGMFQVGKNFELAIKFRRRAAPALTAALVLGASWSAFTAPSRAARISLAVGCVLHLLVPAVQLARSVVRWRTSTYESPFSSAPMPLDRPPLADATQAQSEIFGPLA